MDIKELLAPLRQEIDSIDSQLIPLLEQRMKVIGKVAKVKQANNIPIFDSKREQEVIEKAVANCDPENKSQISTLLRTIMTLSRGQQRTVLSMPQPTLLPAPRAPKEENVVCIYQGVPGSWGEHALMQAYPNATYNNVEFFEDVFIAVRDGAAHYGVVPLENSHTGAIGENYDLLKKYGCYVSGKTTVTIKHCLAAKKGTHISDITEVFSHPQGLKQCSQFLKNRGWIQSACTNTAVAAELTASSDKNVASIGSKRAAELNGLDIIASDIIMNSQTNKTTFIIITSQPEYSKNDNLVCVNFSTLHRSGALCECLTPFMVNDINLLRIESRPGGNDNYRFFAELEGNILDNSMIQALSQAAMASEYFEVIGCYSAK